MACNTSRSVFPLKGRRPASISYSTTPKEKISLRESTGFPDACSGDMYGMVPTIMPGRVRPSVKVRLRSPAPALGELRQAEVRQLGITGLADQDVIRLDVPMQDSRRMGRCQTVRRPAEQFDYLARSASGRPAPGLERATVHELSHQVLPAIELARVIHRQNVRVVERRGGLGLPLKTMPRRRIGEFVGKKFDGDGPVQLGIQRAVNHTHAALAKLALYLVAIEHPPGNFVIRTGLGHVFSGRTIERGTPLRQHRLHFAAYFRLCPIEQGGTFPGRACEGGVV